MCLAPGRGMNLKIIIIFGLIGLGGFACGKAKQSKLLSTQGAIEVGTSPDGGVLVEVDYCPRPPSNWDQWYLTMRARYDQYVWAGIPLIFWLDTHISACGQCYSNHYQACSECRRGEVDYKMYDPATGNERKSSGVYSEPFCIDTRVTGMVNGVPSGIEMTANYWSRKVVRQ